MKFISLFLGFLIFLVPLTIAHIDINFLKDDYLAGEIFQAELIVLDHPINELTLGNIEVYDSKGSKLKIGFILQMLAEDNYFLYAKLPSNLQSGTYNLTIKDLYYRTHNILVKKHVTKKFNITQNGTLLTIEPPLFEIIPDDLPDELILIINNEDIKTTNLDITSNQNFIYPIRSTLTIEPGTQRRLFIRIDKSTFKETKTIISLDYDRFYQIPIYPLAQEIAQPSPKLTPTATPQEAGLNFATALNKITTTIKTDEFLESILPLKNDLNSTLKNIQLYLTGDLNKILFVEPENITILDSFRTAILILRLNPSMNATSGLYQGKLIAESGTYKDEIPVIITVEPSEIIIPSPAPASPMPTFKETASPTPFPNPPEEKKFPLVALIVLISLIVVLFLIFYAIKKQSGDKKPPIKK